MHLNFELSIQRFEWARICGFWMQPLENCNSWKSNVTYFNKFEMPFFLLSMHKMHINCTFVQVPSTWQMRLSYMAVHNLLFFIRYYMRWLTYLDLLQIVNAMTFHVRHSFVFFIIWLLLLPTKVNSEQWNFSPSFPFQIIIIITNDGFCAIIMHEFVQTRIVLNSDSNLLNNK